MEGEGGEGDEGGMSGRGRDGEGGGGRGYLSGPGLLCSTQYSIPSLVNTICCCQLEMFLVMMRMNNLTLIMMMLRLLAHLPSSSSL